jgi:hypothetical protein
MMKTQPPLLPSLLSSSPATIPPCFCPCHSKATTMTKEARPPLPPPTSVIVVPPPPSLPKYSCTCDSNKKMTMMTMMTTSLPSPLFSPPRAVKAVITHDKQQQWHDRDPQWTSAVASSKDDDKTRQEKKERPPRHLSLPPPPPPAVADSPWSQFLFPPPSSLLSLPSHRRTRQGNYCRQGGNQRCCPKRS